jgi:adenylate cyclase class IV
MHNVEFKSELRDPAIAREICRALGAARIGTLDQTDTYYRVPGGKLKKRETVGEAPEVIFYERALRADAKLSHFTIYTLPQAEARFGRDPLPVWVVVRKRRELFMHDRTRVHLDAVDGLGTFFELESLVGTDHTIEDAHRDVAELRRAFAPVLGEPIDCGYADLLAADAEGGRPR